MEELSTYCVYMHRSPSGLVYIGLTKYQDNPNCRWLNGRGYKNNNHFWNAICKYGWDSFEHIILHKNLTLKQAQDLEIEYIQKYNSRDKHFGYNVYAGGDAGSVGCIPWNKGIHGVYHHSEETKRKIGKASKGHVTSEDQKKAISKVHKGRKVSVETRNKIRESLLNTYKTTDLKSRISKTVSIRWSQGYFEGTLNSIRNREVSEETRKKLSEIGKRNRPVGSFHHTDEAKKKMSKAKKGKHAHNAIPVVCVETGILYKSIAEAQAKTGINSICTVVDDLDHVRGGYHWRKYVDKK